MEGSPVFYWSYFCLFIVEDNRTDISHLFNQLHAQEMLNSTDFEKVHRSTYAVYTCWYALVVYNVCVCIAASQSKQAIVVGLVCYKPYIRTSQTVTQYQINCTLANVCVYVCV